MGCLILLLTAEDLLWRDRSGPATTATCCRAWRRRNAQPRRSQTIPGHQRHPQRAPRDNGRLVAIGCQFPPRPVQPGRIGPEPLEVVERPSLLVEDVHHEVAIIHEDPPRVVKA